MFYICMCKGESLYESLSSACWCLNEECRILLGDVPPCLYLRVFFAVGLPKERALSILVSR